MKLRSLLRVAVLGTAASLAISAQDMTPPPAVIKQAQQLLKSKGYYTGEVDGNLSPDLTKSLLAYQEDQDLPKTGVLDTKTTNHMKATMMDEMGSSVKSAGKDAGESLGTEARSAWDEILTVFGGHGEKKKAPAPPDKPLPPKQ
jgi:peptidoglycan hydrolase-like protein with peptidoglycan-binding domain